MTVDRCPITAAQDALTLLRSGRAVMAHRVLEGLPALIEAQLVEAHLMAPLQWAQESEACSGRPCSTACP